VRTHAQREDDSSGGDRPGPTRAAGHRTRETGERSVSARSNGWDNIVVHVVFMLGGRSTHSHFDSRHGDGFGHLRRHIEISGPDIVLDGESLVIGEPEVAGGLHGLRAGPGHGVLSRGGG
jgi:hypothetical protein